MKRYSFALLAFMSLIFNSYAAADIKVQTVAQEMREVLVENYRSEKDAFLTYEACYLNPTGSGLSTIQKQVYCLLPLDFRLCATPRMIRTGNKVTSILSCDKEETYLSIPNFEKVITEVFDSESIDEGEEVEELFSYALDLDKSFVRSLGDLLQNRVMLYVVKSEYELYDGPQDLDQKIL